MDTFYTCSEPGCTYTHRRKAGGFYPSVVPTHHGRVMRQQQVPGDWVQMTDTAHHRVVVSSGGVLVIPLEAIEHEEDERAKDPEALVGYDECLKFSLSEALRLYEILGWYSTQIQTEAPLVDSYHEQAARALLEAFAPEAEKLCMQGKYWWPQVRREAYLCFIQLIGEESNEVINRWRTQAVENDGYPRLQQEEELFRHFAGLYSQKYPAPKREPSDEPKEEEKTNEE